MTVTLPPWLAWAVAALAVLGASALAGLATGAVLAIRQRRTGGPPAPGAGKTPVPGQRAAGVAASPGRPAPAPGHKDHGGDVKIIVVKGDGRVETTDCATGHTEIWPGDCGACATEEGICALCAYWTVFDPLRGRWARRYQRCPAHQDKERQP